MTQMTQTHPTETLTATRAETRTASGQVTGLPGLLLRVEGGALLAASLLAYGQTGGSWALFAALILVPDVFMLGYLAGPRLGALLYNLGHSTILPLAVVAMGWALAAPVWLSLGLIWLAHVGMDRLVGYGLKYPDAFRHTHLSGAV